MYMSNTAKAKIDLLKSIIKSNKEDNKRKLIEEEEFVLYLHGTMKTEKGYIAFVSGEDKSRTNKVTKGQMINKWVIKSIKPTELLLTKGNRKRTVKLLK